MMAGSGVGRGVRSKSELARWLCAAFPPWREGQKWDQDGLPSRVEVANDAKNCPGLRRKEARDKGQGERKRARTERRERKGYFI
jgi:Fe-S-cluster containining protein